MKLGVFLVKNKFLKFIYENRKDLTIGVISGVVSGVLVLLLFTPFLKELAKEFKCTSCFPDLFQNATIENNIFDNALIKHGVVAEIKY